MDDETAEALNQLGTRVSRLGDAVDEVERRFEREVSGLVDAIDGLRRDVAALQARV